MAEKGGKICRWSLRQKDVQIDGNNAWKPDTFVIHDGDEVRLFCHSHLSGAFNTTKETDQLPLYFAPYVMRNPNDDNLRVLEIGQNTFSARATGRAAPELNWSPPGNDIQSAITQYDLGKATNAQKAKLAAYSKFFAYNNKAVFDELCPLLGISGVGSTQVADAFRITAAQYLARDFAAWKNSTGFTNEVIFKVEYL